MERYETIILGSGYFPFGYASTHDGVLIVEETQLADPHFYGTLDGFGLAGRIPEGSALYEAFAAEGLVGEGRLSVNETEPALCRFAQKNMPGILLGTFCARVEKTQEGYVVTLCNNEGISHVCARKIIDTRTGRGNCLGVLVYLPEGKEPCIPSVDGVAVKVEPAFYEDHRLITLTFAGDIDENRAKQRSLAIIEDGLRAVSGKVLQMSYRLFGAPRFAPCRDDMGILHVDETTFDNIFEAYEKGGAWCDEAFDA